MPRRTKDPEAAYVQISLRISPKTQEEIRERATAKNVSQSDIIRAAVAMFKLADTIDGTNRIAVVDLKDKKGAAHYRVKQWILAD